MNSFADLPTIWHWAISLWLAALGGCIGSFLNVVVYRLPAGKSLVHPGSHCPRCGHAIRWYDNVPVFGWLALRGKCRDCHEPIAVRYPLVEALTAAMFFALAWIELLSDGANLPSLVNEHSDKMSLVFHSLTSGELIGIYAFHLLLLSTVLPAALIDYDKQRLPLKLFAPALVVGVVAPSIWPALHPGMHSKVWLITLLFRVLVGLFVGWGLGVLIPLRVKKNNKADDSLSNQSPQQEQDESNVQPRVKDRSNDGIVLVVLCMSLYLGIWAVVVLGVALVVLTLFETILRQVRPGLPIIGPIIWLVLLVPIWLIFWRHLAISFS